MQNQPQTMVVMQQPGATGRGQPQNQREWSSGLCGCCQDCGTCCFAWFCYPCFTCTLSSRMGECACGPFLLRDLFLLGLRTKLRTQHGIKGTILDDCCMVTFCGFCASTQMFRELDTLSHTV